MLENFKIPVEYLTEEELKTLSKVVTRFDDLANREEMQKTFLKFVKHVWPSFIEGKHHRIYADKLERVVNGELKRLVINMTPRNTKAEFA